MSAYAFDRTALIAHVAALKGRKVLIVGDAMLDEYLEGDADRISPEAPIPVVKVSNTRLLLGGAGNVARNIAALGGEARLIGVCGPDAKGEMLRTLLERGSISNGIIALESRPTTLKTRVIARNQQMLRIDHEETAPLRHEEIARILDSVRAVINEFSVLVISDYGKGLISKEMMQGLREIRNTSTSRPRILVDPKTPNFDLYGDVYILTPNAKETSEGAGLPAGSEAEILAAGRVIFKKLGCKHLLTTLGANGMALFESPSSVRHIPTAAQKVFDVTGAGDTVMATLALCLAAGVPLLDACVLANYAAGLVVADVGASTVAPETLRELLAKTPEPVISAWGEAEQIP